MTLLQRQKIKALEAQVASLTTTVTDLRNQVVLLTGQLDTANLQLDAANSEAQRLSAVVLAKDFTIGEMQTQIDTLTQNVADLTTENARLETQIVDLDATNSALKTTNADLEAEVVRLRGVVAQLRKQLAALTYKLPLGYAPEPNTITEMQRIGAWSGATVRRTYKPSGAWPVAWVKGVAAGDAAAGLRTAHTMKGTSGSMQTCLDRLLSGVEDQAILAYLAGSPKDAILGWLHEPEDDRPNPADYRAGQVHFNGLIAQTNAADGGQRLHAGNLMSSSTEAQVMSYYPGDGVWDILGWDGYNWPARSPGASVPAPRPCSDVFDQSLALNQKLGVDFAIFEFGTRRTGKYEDVTNPSYVQTPQEIETQRLWCVAARAWLVDVAKPVVACYFHHDWWLMQQSGHKALGGKA